MKEEEEKKLPGNFKSREKERKKEKEKITGKF